ncbi:MAG TPA: DUF3160 domain-containing protein, partial [Polyangiaceae bacterium]|nr:DUF3160 domain-containing protein [Polyangiaceae bacterium]
MARGLVGRLGCRSICNGIYFGLAMAGGVLAACGDVSAPAVAPSGGGTPGEPPVGEDPEPASPGGFLADAPRQSVSLTLASPDLGALRSELVDAYATSAAELQAQHAVQHLEALSYDPGSAAGLDLIAVSPLGLDIAERAVLGERGFVISPRHEFPTFTYGYNSIYAADLPVFITADMMLDAVHRSFDLILAQMEFNVLRPQLERLLRGMRGRLASGAVALDATVAADVDVYLTVAL